jgi:mandelamide amidase
VGLCPGNIRRDTIGWLARSCADIELLDRISSTATEAPAPQVDLRGLHLGVPRAFFYEDLDPDVAASIERALHSLSGHGAVVIEVDVPQLGEIMGAIAANRTSNLAEDLALYIKESGANITPEAIIHAVADPQLRAQYEAGLAVPRESAEAAQAGEDKAVEALKQAYAACFQQHDLAALVIPTTPVPAYPIPDNYMEGGTGPISMIRNTLPGANAGIPGLSVPAGLTSTGLPIGIEFDGPEGRDVALLRIGQAFEAITAPLPPPPVPA